MRKLAPRLGGTKAIDFYQQPLKINFNFCYINNQRNYLINYVDQIFQNSNAEMFVNDCVFTIHPSTEKCPNLTDGNNTATSNDEDDDKKNFSPIQIQMDDFMRNTYPKNKILPIIFRKLVKHDLIDDDLFFVPFPNIHVADFCNFLNNRFAKKNKANVSLLKLCRFLRDRGIKFPLSCIKNPIARSVL
jgi:hypothetical protein